MSTCQMRPCNSNLFPWRTTFPHQMGKSGKSAYFLASSNALSLIFLVLFSSVFRLLIHLPIPRARRSIQILLFHSHLECCFCLTFQLYQSNALTDYEEVKEFSLWNRIIICMTGSNTQERSIKGLVLHSLKLFWAYFNWFKSIWFYQTLSKIRLVLFMLVFNDSWRNWSYLKESQTISNYSSPI